MISKRQTPCKKVLRTQKISKQVPISIEYSSRHFSPAVNLLSLENGYGFSEYSEQDEKCLKVAVQSLNHDENSEISDLILKCWKCQASSYYNK